MCAKKKYRAADYLHYLRDELPERERYELERHLEADPFEKEALEGMETLDQGALEEDILSLHARLKRRLGRRRRRNWYGIAATAASILIVGTIFLNIYDTGTKDAEEKGFTEESFRDLTPAPKAEALTEEPEIVAGEAKSVTEEPEIEAGEAKSVTEEAEIVAREAEIVAVEAEAQRRVAQAEVEVAEEAEIVALEAEVAEEAAPLQTGGTGKAAAPEAARSGEKAEPSREKAEASREKAAPARQKAPLPTAHETTVSGILVSSEDNKPIPGAVVVVKGSGSGTTTDIEGRFKLPAEDSQTTVVASFIGMETQEYALVENAENRLMMEPDATSLDEVVVVGYGADNQVGGTESGSATVVDTERNGEDYKRATPLEGYRAFRHYVQENMVFPETHDAGQKKIVVLKFLVSERGELRDISIIRSPGPDYSNEAIRLLEQGPGWNPAIRDEKPVEEQVRIRIVFKK